MIRLPSLPTWVRWQLTVRWQQHISQNLRLVSGVTVVATAGGEAAGRLSPILTNVLKYGDEDEDKDVAPRQAVRSAGLLPCLTQIVCDPRRILDLRLRAFHWCVFTSCLFSTVVACMVRSCWACLSNCISLLLAYLHQSRLALTY